MIHGIGVDIISVARVERLTVRHGAERFARRILHESEWDDFRAARQPARFLAKRFAVKEAAAKALGTAIRGGVQFADFALGHAAAGTPQLRLHGVAAERAAAAAVVATQISLSDEVEQVVAFAVFERADPLAQDGLQPHTPRPAAR